MIKRHVLALCLLAAACMPSGEPRQIEAPADAKAGETRFDLAGPTDAAILIPVYINDTGPYQFVLDTGATLTCVDIHLADKLQLRKKKGVIGYGAGIGGAGKIQILEIDALRVGETTVRDLTACSADLGQIQRVGIRADGLLGLNFLKPFRVGLDFKRKVLVLEKQK